MTAIQLDGVRRAFGRTLAVDRVDLTVSSGEIVGLIGHNGAGKSTCLGMIMGLVAPGEGHVRIAGHDVVTAPDAARAALGAVPEHPAVFEWLSAREFLSFVADVRGGDPERALEITGLGDDADRLIREYSQGMRRKVAIAAAMLGDPKALVLDEALNGLDPPSAVRVKTALRAYADAGGAVLLSTHVVETVASLADRVVMLARGRVVEDRAVEGLGPGELERLFLERIGATRDAI